MRRAAALLALLLALSAAGGDGESYIHRPRPPARRSCADIPLCIAAYEGDGAKVAGMIAAIPKADVDEQDFEGYTPLMFAAKNNHPKVVGQLLAAGADAGVVHDMGHTAASFLREPREGEVRPEAETYAGDLLLAASGGDLQRVQRAVSAFWRLLAPGEVLPQARALAYSKTPALGAYFSRALGLHNEHCDIVEFIDELRWRPALTDDIPLVKAANDGDLRAVRSLLATPGVDVDEQCTSGNTALMGATSKDHTSIVDALLAAGARTDLQNVNGWTALDGARGDDVAALLRAAAKKTPAHRVAEAKAEAELREKPELRLRRLLTDDGGATSSKGCYDLPLCVASLKGNLAEVRRVLKANPDYDVNTRDRAGYTALVKSAINGNALIVDVLLNAGADPNVRSKRGFTALRFAAVRAAAPAAAAAAAADPVSPADE